MIIQHGGFKLSGSIKQMTMYLKKSFPKNEEL